MLNAVFVERQSALFCVRGWSVPMDVCAWECAVRARQSNVELEGDVFIDIVGRERA